MAILCSSDILFNRELVTQQRQCASSHRLGRGPFWLSEQQPELLLSRLALAAGRPDLIQRVGGQPARGAAAAPSTLTYKVSNEGAVKVGDLLHAPRDVGRSRGTTGVTAGLFFIVVIAKDKAQQETGHHNVSNAQHREVTASGAGIWSHM